MAQGTSDTILVAIWITLRIWESKVRNPDPPDRQRFVLCECILVLSYTVYSFKFCMGRTLYTQNFKTVYCITKNNTIFTHVHTLHYTCIKLKTKHTWCNMLLESGIVELVVFVSDCHYTVHSNNKSLHQYHNVLTTTMSQGFSMQFKLKFVHSYECLVDYRQ